MKTEGKSSAMTIAFASYFDYTRYEPVLPPLAAGAETGRHAVAIVGGGPIGLALALGLARQGVRSVVIEADESVCTGSRAGCVTRRTLEIFEQLGMADPVMRQGLPWAEGWSYHRTREVFHLQMPRDELARYPALVNIQQCYVEQYLVERIAQVPELVEIRWQSRVTGLRSGGDGAELDIETPLGGYTLRSDWVVACDGAKSEVRKALGLRFAGTNYEARYVIADIRMKSALPPGRRAWFNPPSNPGATLLLHKHRNDLWRFDYQLRDDEDAEQAVRPENVLARIRSHLELIGETAPWSPVWISMYKASSLTLERYRHERVLLAGDAAHLVPIFGVRGMNSGIDDSHNLAWKLAFVIRGWAAESLLDSYSEERLFATRENMRHASRSAEFMDPPSVAFKVMREAVLALADDHLWVRSLINPRQSTSIGLPDSPLNAPSDAFAAGPAPGDTFPDAPVTVVGEGRQGAASLTGLLGGHFTVLVFPPAGGLDAANVAQLSQLRQATPPCAVWTVWATAPAGARLPAIVDTDGQVRARLDATDGCAYVARPDGHVLGRWKSIDVEAIRRAIAACCGLHAGLQQEAAA
jgi:3-(3-hydroxy-phenyl)propionate hydroxylase